MNEYTKRVMTKAGILPPNPTTIDIGVIDKFSDTDHAHSSYKIASIIKNNSDLMHGKAVCSVIGASLPNAKLHVASYPSLCSTEQFCKIVHALIEKGCKVINTSSNLEILLSPRKVKELIIVRDLTHRLISEGVVLVFCAGNNGISIDGSIYVLLHELGLRSNLIIVNSVLDGAVAKECGDLLKLDDGCGFVGTKYHKHMVKVMYNVFRHSSKVCLPAFEAARAKILDGVIRAPFHTIRDIKTNAVDIVPPILTDLAIKQELDCEDDEVEMFRASYESEIREGLIKRIESRPAKDIGDASQTLMMEGLSWPDALFTKFQRSLSIATKNDVSGLYPITSHLFFPISPPYYTTTFNLTTASDDTVAAYGSNISCADIGETYKILEGTSFAAPMVTAAIARLIIGGRTPVEAVKYIKTSGPELDPKWGVGGRILQI